MEQHTKQFLKYIKKNKYRIVFNYENGSCYWENKKGARTTAKLYDDFQDEERPPKTVITQEELRSPRPNPRTKALNEVIEYAKLSQEIKTLYHILRKETNTRKSLAIIKREATEYGIQMGSLLSGVLGAWGEKKVNEYIESQKEKQDEQKTNT